MERVLSDPSLVQASYYFCFYVDEAMREAGLADRYLGRLTPWQDMLRSGLTATAETRTRPARTRMLGAAGQVPHPKGPINVQLQRLGSFGIDARITLPVGVTGEFRWRDQAVPLRSGANRVRCQQTCA